MALAVMGGLSLVAGLILLLRRSAPLEVVQGPTLQVQEAWDAALDQARRVDVNTASVAELERLPQVGPALAHRIVAHREAAGRFRAPEELRRVKGIGSKTYEALMGYVTAE
jgi:competence protein ComEA